ncbi:hydrogenase 4 subunit B [Rhodovulum euryhalinum]|uniref:Formate hydrogenlyase subunit 3/multisubunit Na+/H+ antiporter MnhD subunit n=1 Tax=Rhodovulum euryhalinum TaxID=35805 RepID=A0A4V2SA04_9RHOB|nr:hydrogenase 4 subunit B [Rhodovulum euryhalinum]TCO69400.1 formate hydrogenlyase subunit 3/multisubunit Na+/H+ antiporter MnhD subunit [Rhodovulum euryhalinum]
MIAFAVCSVLCLLGLSLAAIGMRDIRAASAIVYGASGVLCAGLVVVGLRVLATQADAESMRVPVGLPWLGAHLQIDALAAVFLVLLGTGGAAASLYAIGYGRHEHAPLRVLPFYPGFLGAMTLVVLAADAFTFLLSWEVMSLLSWAMVLTHHREEETRSAAYLYLVMASLGTMMLLLAFGLMAGAAGGYEFAAMREAERSPGVAALVLGLMMVGAGSKAGLVPLHVWLPVAHPAAPSHVSALMSGVMTKVAVYGFVRVAFDLLDPVVWWMSVPVIVAGAGTAVMGILFANVDADAKRILAYSTIENIGVIFAALGLALAFRANGMDVLAALALTAGLIHAMNHMLFKSLLFMVAGAVLTATGRQDLDALGGLIHRMPKTALLALVGVTAIAALPPLNGFVSEWLLFQAVLQSPNLTQPGLQFLVPAAGGLLALAAALAAACFVRFFGVIFLGRPRTNMARDAAETDRWSLAAMAGLALLCVLAGVVPGLLIDLIAPAIDLVLGARMPAQADNAWFTLVPVAEVQSSYSGFLVMVFVAISGGAAAAAVYRFSSRRTRRAPAWDCGFPDADPITQYGAGSFAQPIRRVMAPMIAARETVIMPPPGDMGPARHSVVTEDLAWTRLYLPLSALVGLAATRLNALQFLTIRRYLALVFASLILLLTGLTIWN